MKTYTRTYDIETGALLKEAFFYEGPVELCKGESKQQMGISNADAAAMMKATQEQLAKYNQFLDLVTRGGGYLPGVKEAAVSNAVQSVPQNYNQIAQQLQTVLGARGAAGGGTQPGSGLLGRGLGELYSSEEATKSNLLNQITLQGQQNILGAQMGGLNAAGITGGAFGNALGSATSAANQANQSSGLLGTIIGGGLGVLGSAIKPGSIP